MQNEHQKTTERLNAKERFAKLGSAAFGEKLTVKDIANKLEITSPSLYRTLGTGRISQSVAWRLIEAYTKTHKKDAPKEFINAVSALGSDFGDESQTENDFLGKERKVESAPILESVEEIQPRSTGPKLAKKTKPKRTYNIDKALGARVLSAIQASPRAPAKKHGTLTWVARELSNYGADVAPETVRKWTKGITTPRGENLEALCALLNVDSGWLVFGTTPVATKTELTRTRKDQAAGIYYLLGWLQLSGVSAVMPEEGDVVAERMGVDIYAIADGRQRRLSCAVARRKESNLVFNFPAEAADNELIGIWPTPSGTQIFQLPMNKVANGSITVVAEDSSKGIAIGKEQRKAVVRPSALFE